MNYGYKDSFTTASKFRCYSVLVEASYDHVLPPPKAKGSQHISCISYSFR